MMKKTAILCISVVVVVFACLGTDVTNTMSSVSATGVASLADKSWEVAKSYVPEVRGNALWDVLKLLLLLGYKVIAAIFFLFFLIPAFFSQRWRTIWFRKGFGALRLFRAESFGELVSVEKERRQYRRISSNKRDEVVRRINEHSGVFLVMGPAGAGKGVLIRAESAASHVLRVEGRLWYDGSSDSSPVREILKQRTRLLTRWFPFRKPVCIILEWDPLQELPDDWRMNKMLADLARFLGSRTEFDKLSFVVKVPAYYALDSLSQGDLGKGLPPEVLSVNLLAPSECESLLNEQLSAMEAKGPGEVAKCRDRLVKRAEGHGVGIAKMIWVESFGRPRYVVDIVQREFHDSLEAWKGLRDWWLQVYSPEKTKQNWLAYLYVLALRGALGNGVDLEETFRGSGLDYLNEVYPAVKRLCAKEKFRAKNFDVALIFGKDDNYIRDSYLLSLGLMERQLSGKDMKEVVFDFQDQLATALGNMPEAKDAETCERIAYLYHDMNESEPNLVERLERHYAFLGRLRGLFGDGPLVAAYRRLLDDPVLGQRFLENVVSRIGALNAKAMDMLFTRLNAVCKDNLSPSQYVDRVFAMLPVYVVSSWYATGWQISFDNVVSVATSSAADARMRFRCAIIEALALMSVENALKKPNFKSFHDNRRKELDEIIKTLRDDVGEWREFCSILDFVELQRCPDASDVREWSRKDADVRISWLCAFDRLSRMVVSDAARPAYMRCLKVVQQILEASDGISLENLLSCYVWSRMDSDIDLTSEEGGASWRQEIENLSRFLDRWSECPMIAMEHFERLCHDYSAATQDSPHLLSARMMWSLVQVVKEWRSGMSDTCFSRVLASFAKLMVDVSDCTEIEIDQIWNEYSDMAIGFWMRRLCHVDDTCMIDDYFVMIKSVSKLGRVSLEKRMSFVQQLRYPSNFLADQLNSSNHACLVRDCSDEVFPPPIKYLMAAEVLTGIPLAKDVKGDAEIIQAAEDILSEARAMGRPLDEDLICEFRTMNGLAEA